MTRYFQTLQSLQMSVYGTQHGSANTCAERDWTSTVMSFLYLDEAICLHMLSVIQVMVVSRASKELQNL